MIELRTLGTLDLRTPDGASVGSVLAQPKRLALLVHLALEAPDGFLRRDSLLALFWPEADDDRARAALRQAIRYLRRSLGEATIVGRADDEIGMAPGALRCDAVELRRALAAGDDERALELHAGELLPGFHVEDAPGFERWLDEQRSRLRLETFRAAERLSRQAESDGDLPAALRWASRASELQPLDEAALRRLLSLLGRSGDRTGAVAAYQEFERRLAAELELQPSAETTALIDRVRRPAGGYDGQDPTGDGDRLSFGPPAAAQARRSGSLAADSRARDRASPDASSPDAIAPVRIRPDPLTPSPVAGGPTAPDRYSADPGSPAPTAPLHVSPDRFDIGPADTDAPTGVVPPRRWRRPVIAAGGAALALTFALGLSLATPNRSAAPTPGIGRVLVAPFQNRTLDPTLDPIGRMAADWIIEGVSRTELFEVVPSTAVWASAQHAGSRADVAEATWFRELARETGASVLVAGSYYRAGDRLHLQAQLLDAADGRVLRPVGAVDAPMDSLVHAVDRLRDRVLAAIAPLSDTVYHIRFLTVAPPTYEAYREYLAGMEAFVGGDPATALRHYERSAAADPEYPMPRLAAAIMHMNLGDFLAADSIAAEVAPVRDRLGPLERNTHDFVLAVLRGHWPSAYDAMSRAARIAPGTINEYMVGEVARRMNRPREAIRVLENLGTERGELRGWRMYWRDVGWSYHMLGDHRRELRETRRGRALHPNDPFVLSLEVGALAALGRIAEVDARIQERLANPSTGAPIAGVLMTQAADELEAHGHPLAAARLRERSVAWFESLPTAERSRPVNRNRYGIALASAGQLPEALDAFAALVEEHPDNPFYLGRLGVVHAQLGNRAEAERISSELGRKPPMQGRSGPLSPGWGEQPFARAAIAAHLGDPDRAVELLREAQSRGLSFGPHLHSDPMLQPLRHHPGFREWLRPKG